jgi:predicted RNA-binding protein with PUA-like domain
VKSDPDTYGWDDLVKDGGTRWDGVRNAQARNHLAEMGVGDLVLVYHSNAKEVVGVAKVTKAAYPDPTADDERWVAVELAPIAALRRAVTLAAIKSEPALATIGLVRQGRLSVMPIEDRAFARILALGDTVLRGARAGRAPHDLTTKSPFR